jgi:murein DD-endopeptidase MepM/ murein hydrolase activator NlpD
MIALAAIAAMLSIPQQDVRADRFTLPTGNRSLLTGADSAFYQGTSSGREAPWEGGRYGFVRNPRQTKEGTVYTRFHDGVDIRPLYRDARNEPLDTVMAIADGTVVHASDVAGYSNYGRYVVVEHDWDGAPVYSLYAHLNEVWVKPGDVLHQGEMIGRLGYTGAGINRARAHLHLEITLLLNEHFETWFGSFYKEESNRHGMYNGINLVGMDVARLYLALQENPDLTPREFLDGEQALYTVSVPIETHVDMLRRYPWLLTARPGPDARSWTIHMTGSGLPLRVEPSSQPAEKPSVAMLLETKVPYRYLSKSMLCGSGEHCALSGSGARYIGLLTASGEEEDVVPLDIEERDIEISHNDDQ